MVKVKQGKVRKITKVKANKSKARQGKCKSRQSRGGGAEQRQSLQGVLKKAKWGCPPSLATRELVTA